jgi:DNA mismatch endonuclease (patch repair protein)
MSEIVLIPPTEARSRNMSAIRSVNTRPELAVRRSFHSAGFRFQLHRSDLPGKPDVVFPRHHLAVFIHGCFWHGHVCQEARRPQSNLTYWNPKLDRNVTRDARSAKKLRQLGWAVFIIRECRLSDGITRVTRKLKSLKAA